MSDFSAKKNHDDIKGTSEDDDISVVNYNQVIVRALEGDDQIYSSRADSLIANGGNGEDYFSLYNDSYASIDGGIGNDTVISEGVDYGGSTIYGGIGNDLIGFNNCYMLVDGGEGNDLIRSRPDESRQMSNGYNTILGGAGNDSIYSSYEATITGGTGDDYISLQGAYSHSVVINYASGDGNDTIEGFSFRSGSYTPTVLQLAVDNYTTTTSAHEGTILTDIIIQFSDGGSITFPEVSESLIEGDDFVISIAGAQTDDTSLSKVDGVYTYSGGSKIISNYASEKINLATDFTGIGLTDTSFLINSSSGSLTIKNARGKVIDAAVNNQTVAYVYMADDKGDIDGSSFSQLEIIIGARGEKNNITAGSGGSSLWGGMWSNDTLTGGAGADTFFFGEDNCDDVINNAASNDTIFLYDISLSEIVSVDYGANQISLEFDSVDTLEVNSAENLSAKFILADNSAWRYNHSSGQWQNA